MSALSGIRVVSIAVNLPGPVATSLLRDLGATIVKIEPLTGDPLSGVAPDWYGSLCSGMEVLRFDLKASGGRERLNDLLAAADILITSSRPASLHRLGLGWPDLHGRHPQLCHVAIVGFPPPREDLAGHDVNYQAEAGLVTPPAMPRSLVADIAGAQRAAIAALELLFARERRGQAGYAQVALADCARLFAEPFRHRLTAPTGPLGGTDAAYNLYPARDGWVAVGALEPHLRLALARELGVDIEDRYAVAQALLSRSAVEWQQWAETRGLPLAAVRESPP
jgi:crotonobetainyl-CoA:carnitine CoA-transferase CaiB-like acyl-CoA transferase